MNAKKFKECPSCARKGVPVSGTDKCRFCGFVPLRPDERYVYLACVSGVLFVDGKGAFLDGHWSAQPFLSRKEAEAYLDAYIESTVKQWAPTGHPVSARPETVDRYAGRVLYTNSGPLFLFVSETRMDCSALFREEPRTWDPY